MFPRRGRPYARPVNDETLPRDLIRRYGLTYPAGRAILRQGEVSTDLYVVLSGVVSFWERRVGEPEHLIALGGRGTIFGEVGAFAGRSRTASVRAGSAARLLRLPRPVALDLVSASPSFAQRVIEALARRLGDQSERGQNGQGAQAAA
jgi:CRP/FNR family cyclic AMP-dependent transcriptional regulator